ncbi:uncharacterized protein LOC121383647 [Gigantopelta aegis]|uniref:uncharacterized protein LOC121383647 n=1 Tax=Gigantopelta aegis TaxID=1735272 RepID=UPI001B88C2E7|nr:uncharacterized protein LOC121383647 [Gigantopelta aegis]
MTYTTFSPRPYSAIGETHCESGFVAKDHCVPLSLKSYNISSYEKVKYVHLSSVGNPVFCRDLVCSVESFPPSTSCSFDVEIHTPLSPHSTQYSSVSMDFCIFNGIGRTSLVINALYLLVFQPVFTCVGNRGITTVVRGNKLGVMISTDCNKVSVRANIKYIPYDKISNSVFCRDLFQMIESVSPSLLCTYDLQIHTALSETISYSSVSDDFCIFNAFGKTDLEPGTMYRVELYPTFTPLANQESNLPFRGSGLSVTLITDRPSDS